MKKKQVKKEQMGWPEAVYRMVDVLVILGVIYCVASCTAGHSII